jgi:hypothetical protein
MSVTVADAPSLVPFVRNPEFAFSGHARSVVQINGASYLPIRWNLTTNGHGATDSGTLTLKIWGNSPDRDNPDFSVLLSQTPDATVPQADQGTANNGADQPVYCQIFAGLFDDGNVPAPESLSTSGMVTRFIGILDNYSAKFKGNEVTFALRSIAAPLVDNKITQATGAQTGVDFARAQATALGLGFVSILPNGYQPIRLQEVFAREFIGGANFDAEIHNKRIWDLIIQCALFDDCDVFVDPVTATLYYANPSLLDRIDVDLAWGDKNSGFLLADAEGTHSLQFSKNIQVEVRTYQKRIKQSTTVRVSTDPNGGGVTITQRSATVTSSPNFGTNQSVSQSISPTGGSTTIVSGSGGGYSSGFTAPGKESGKQRYVIYVPNLTPQQANNLAQALWRDYTMHEYGLKIKLPVRPELLNSFSVTSLVHIAGLPYAEFNSDASGGSQNGYWPRRIEESFDRSGGWWWDADLLNHALANGAV